jgi:hypothetical protein
MKTAHRAILHASVWLACLLTATIAPQLSRAQSPPKVSAAISFRCLWWSDQQKNGLNPNSPPPKNTEVTISKWEYSDPIEVPHPDVVDIVVDLRNQADRPAENLVVDISALWKIGQKKNKARAAWGKPFSLKRMPAIRLEARGAQSFRVPINLAEKMTALSARRFWPWALRAQVTVSTRSGKLLQKITIDLPIIPGD